MYLPPSNFQRKFIVEAKTTTLNDEGRKITTFKPTGRTMWAILSNASSKEQERWEMLKHPITHTIVVKGDHAEAQVGERLTLNGRTFYIQGRDNASCLGWYTLYYVEEREKNDG